MGKSNKVNCGETRVELRCGTHDCVPRHVSCSGGGNTAPQVGHFIHNFGPVHWRLLPSPSSQVSVQYSAAMEELFLEVPRGVLPKRINA